MARELKTMRNLVRPLLSNRGQYQNEIPFARTRTRIRHVVAPYLFNLSIAGISTL
jgi:hypothetical protein